MPKLSRRNIIAGVAVAPALNGKEHAAKPGSAELPRTAPTPKPDPIVAKVAACIAARDAIDAMMEEWAELEVALCARIKSSGLTLTQACRSRLPEARAMRALDRKIRPGLQRLDRAAQRIALMHATSAQGALAKVRLGVRIQGPHDWNDDYVHALVQDGCEQLVVLLSR